MMGALTWLFQVLLCFSHYQVACSSSSLRPPFASSAHYPLCRHDQRSALLQFKHMFTINSSASSICDDYYGIPSHPKTRSWDENAAHDCCDWDGVTCDGLTGHVIGLDLSCSQLYGTIQPNSSLFQLSHLQRLNLANNHFNFSRISYVFGSFASLTHLNLSWSAFSGSVPSELSLLSKLISLDLSSYLLKLEPLHFKILVRNLTQLQELVLNWVNISSSLPESLMNLSSLTALDLSSTELLGNLPDSIFHLPNLQRLLLRNNEDLIVNLPKSTWGSGSSLKELDLSSTNLSRELPDLIGNLKSLKSLDLSETSLSGKLPDSIGNLKSLKSLHLSQTSLSGKLPDLSANRIDGQILNWVEFIGKASLLYLNLSHNFLTGIKQFSWEQLDTLDLRSNLLQGPLPIPPPSINLFFISNNNLSGEITSLICNASSLLILDLSHNKLSGAVPQCLGNFSSVLSVLNLRSNGFTGTLALEFAKPNELRSLDLSGNQFEGQLPRSLAICTSLEVLNVGNNKIDDTFPYWLGTLPQLQVLVVRSNRFHGPMNTFKSKFFFPRLRIVDLSGNAFTGYLPAGYFEHFQAMKNGTMPNDRYMSAVTGNYHDSLIVTMKGLEIEMVRILTIFTTIDLSSNNFSGEIPNAIGKLYSLKVLNFSHNSLTSHIPESLGDLTSLESLDISSNHLIGRIPSQLTSLTFLAVLNLSCNRLHGPIPNGRQFNTFENSSYAGNSELCGFPLSKECGDNRTDVQPSVSQQEEDDSDFDGFTWKIVVIGYGCGMALGLFLGSLMFLIGRPRFFVRLAERKLPEKVIRLRRMVVDIVA